MKNISKLTIFISLLISSAAFAQVEMGNAAIAPNNTDSKSLELVIDGHAAKVLYLSLMVAPVSLGQGLMAIKRGENISCYAGIPDANRPAQEQTEMFICVLQVNPDGTTKGQH